jgi:Predicted 3'-5' exonuclease related to the exonuclease domain of PolB
MKNYVFDIETVPLPTEELEKLMPVFDPASVKTGQFGPEKAAEKIEKMRQEQFKRFMRDAALSAISGQIAMIGIRDDTGLNTILDREEKLIIADWFQFFQSAVDHGAHWIGFNIASFDLPFLIRRAWFHRLKIPYGIVRGRYLTGFFTDLLQLWTGSEYSSRFEVSLGDLAQFFGAGVKTGNGANFDELLRYKPGEARAYLKNDLEITWKVAEAMGALKGPHDQPAAVPNGPDPGPTIDPIEAPGSQIQFY